MDSNPIELHVWSPAFDLPSFDPECLAAIAYLNVALPKDFWVIVESNNPSISPNGGLPALRDGDKWVGGFENIVAHVNEKSGGRVNLDKDLRSKDRALSTAFSSFIQYHALPILSLSLYISPQNYANVVRPMYSRFLPFLLRFYIPSEHHSLAVDRTAHLHWVASTFGYDDQGIPPASVAFANLTVPSTTAENPEDKPAGEKITTRIRLKQLVREFLQPIEDQIGGKKCLLGDKPSVVDCYLVGYLSLFIYPKLPYPWLSEIMTSEFPEVCEYVEALRESMLPKNEELPWKQVDPENALTASGWVADTVKGYFGGGSRGQLANDLPKTTRIWPMLQAGSGFAAIGALAFLATRERDSLLGVSAGNVEAEVEAIKPAESPRVGGDDPYDISANSFLGIRR